eukprot:353978-Chlamydomonas_euryale.AAC.2
MALLSKAALEEAQRGRKEVVFRGTQVEITAGPVNTCCAPRAALDHAEQYPLREKSDLHTYPNSDSGWHPSSGRGWWRTCRSHRGGSARPPPASTAATTLPLPTAAAHCAGYTARRVDSPASPAGRRGLSHLVGFLTPWSAQPTRREQQQQAFDRERPRRHEGPSCYNWTAFSHEIYGFGASAAALWAAARINVVAIAPPPLPQRAAAGLTSAGRGGRLRGRHECARGRTGGRAVAGRWLGGVAARIACRGGSAPNATISCPRPCTDAPMSGCMR